MRYNEVADLIEDARAKPGRLTGWERDFIDSVSQTLAKLDDGDCNLTEKQIAVLRKIENKVYATG